MYTPGVSVTKFLHFSFLNIFPVIDLNTMERLGRNGVNLMWYSDFLIAWADIYRKH